jgi:hypothetical protein
MRSLLLRLRVELVPVTCTSRCSNWLLSSTDELL